jgi:hypothetical protein
MLTIYEDVKIANKLQLRSKFLENVARFKCDDRLAGHLNFIALHYFEDSRPLFQDFQIPVQEQVEEVEDQVGLLHTFENPTYENEIGANGYTRALGFTDKHFASENERLRKERGDWGDGDGRRFGGYRRGGGR